MNETLQTALEQFIGNSGQTARSAVVLENPSAKAVRALRASGHDCLRTFSVMPSIKAPRWLLPLGNSRATLCGFQIYTPYAPLARILKTMACAGIRAGWNGCGCHHILVACREALPLEALVAETTGESRPVFSMSLGTPGRYRKLTVQVMRPSGEILGYLKLPLTDVAGARVRREAEVLERLRNYESLRPHIPKLLYAGEWGGGYILFQSAGPPTPGPVEFSPLHDEFLQTLWCAYEVEKSGETLLADVAARWERASLALNSEWRELGKRVLEAARRQLQGITVPCGISHGDFAPWNTRLEANRLFLFDWESAAWDMPILWDIFHYHVQVTSRLKRTNRAGFVLDRTRGENGCFLLYLLNSVLQYLDEGGPSHSGIEYRKRILLREPFCKGSTL